MAQSLYPDGRANDNWARLRIVLPLRAADGSSGNKVRRDTIHKVICHRVTSDGHEEYLVHWKALPPANCATALRPQCYSWHDLLELSECLSLIQAYLEREKHKFNSVGVKRRANGEAVENPSRATSSRATPDPLIEESEAKPVYSVANVPNLHVINGTLKRENGTITMQPGSITVHTPMPTVQMLLNARECDTRQAQFAIRTAFDSKLNIVKPPGSLEIINQWDGSRPPLDFEFIEESEHGEGVQPTPEDTIVACGHIKARSGPNGGLWTCRPNMGQEIGCEYSRVCECLEFAAVDEKRLDAEGKALLDQGETAGLPKRFPYLRNGVLHSFYLESRHAIYECNKKCLCGPNCKNRLVQKGRQVPLQIFKTRDRGWGIRCRVNLSRGEFIDTYRGEIITDAEATRREKDAISGLKASYLYSLDKHIGDNDLKEEDCYVVDGEFKGGPTRFINHSCEPNVGQYTVSYNKYDYKIYELAFFAKRDIRAYEELTFDYQDKDEEDSDSDRDAEDQGPPASSQSGGKAMIKCRCGSDRCRKRLWL